MLRFDENEDTEVAAPNNVVIQAHQGDVNLISTNGKIRIHGAIELGGSDLSGTIVTRWTQQDRLDCSQH